MSQKKVNEIEKLLQSDLRNLKDISYTELQPLLKQLYKRSGRLENEELWTLDEENIQTELIRIRQQEEGFKPCFNDAAEKTECDELNCYWRGMCVKDTAGVMSVLLKILEVDDSFFYLEDYDLFFRDFDEKITVELSNLEIGTLLKKMIKTIVDRFLVPINIDTLLNRLNNKITIPPKVVDIDTFYQWYKSLGNDKKRKIAGAIGLNYNETLEKNSKRILPYLKTKITFNKFREPIMTKNNYLKIKKANFQIPESLVLFTGLDCTELDNYYLQYNNEIDLDGLEFVIENKHNIKIKGVLVKVSDDVIIDKGLEANSYYLTIKRQDIPDKKSIKDDYNFTIRIVDEVRDINIKIEEPETTEAVLCIDFGTSNTTAGSKFLTTENERLNELRKNEFNYVKFKKELEWVYSIPTILLVQDLTNTVEKFLIGYEAEKEIIKHEFNPNGTILKGIKKYLGNMEANETIYDMNRKREEIKKAEIVKFFIEYVIQTAENQFKCKFKNLHFSTPIAHKDEYLASLCKIFAQYNIRTGNESLDEGIAVLYDIISKEKKIYKNSTSAKVLVIDCGGGTTDLASCNFKITEDITDNIEIVIEREECEPDFGGNKITERILQYMQIILANSLDENIKTNINQLIPNEARILDEYENGIELNNIYGNLEEVCESAEEIIPMKFEVYKNDFDDYKLVKKNYYLLWNLAEQIKIAFFSTNEVTSENLPLQINNNRIQLYKIINKSPLRLEQDDFKVPSFTIRDIEALIYADIYSVLQKLLKDISQEELLSYDYLRLSGQSSRIGLFRNVLKEFIPGRKIKFNNNNQNEDLFEKLKLNCLRGAISYNNEFNSGFVEVSIKYKSTPKLKMPIYIKGRKGMQLLFKEGIDQTECADYIDVGEKATIIEFKIGEKEKSFNIKESRINRFKKLSTLEERLNYYNPKKFDFDQIKLNACRVIVFVDDRQLKIGAVKRENNEYLLSEFKSYELNN